MSIFDCTTCGACCQSPALKASPDGWVDLTFEEADALGPRLAKGSHYFPYVVMRERKDGRCIALVGEIGKACSCRIYDHRPSVCQTFEPGNIQCLEARKRVGLLA